MAIVVNPQVLPYQQTTRDKLLEALIQAAPQLVAAAVTHGMSSVRNIPNPVFGQTGSPGTQFSVAGPQGNPLAPPQNPQQALAGVQPRVPSAPYASQPMLNAQELNRLVALQTYKQGELKTKQAQQSLDPLSPLNQFLSAQAAQMHTTAQQQANNGSSGALSEAMRLYLAKRALAGDDEADDLLQEHGF